jgi:hypothetical protein
MASTTDTTPPSAVEPDPLSGAAAVITEEDLEAARRDPRVQAFLEEADAYVAELDRQGRNR